MFIDPIGGSRGVSSREHPTRVDWSGEIRQLKEVDYPHAHKIKLLCDNLNTHHIASLYEAFDGEQAHRLAPRVKLYFTPRNGSCLNITEIKLSILQQQCLKGRIGDAHT
jgi:hypothetical protein